MAIPKQESKQNQSSSNTLQQRDGLSSSLRIVAAGRGATMSHPRIVETVLSLVHDQQGFQPEHPVRVVYLGTATYDEPEPMESQTKGFQKAGCEVIPLRVSERVEQQPSPDYIHDTIMSAHVIQVSGGNTLYAVNRWKKLGIDRLLRQRANEGAVMCGGSAGSICWFQEGHSQSMNPAMALHVDPNLTDEQRRSWEYIRVDGLGILPGFCVPHHDVEQSNGVPRELDSSKMMMKELPHQTGVGIDENAALVIEGSMVRVVSVREDSAACVKMCEETDDGELQVVVYPFQEHHGAVPMLKLVKNPSQVLDNYYRTSCSSQPSVAQTTSFAPMIC